MCASCTNLPTCQLNKTFTSLILSIIFIWCYVAVMNLSIVKTAISIPIRFGDFQMFGAGEWSLYEMDMKIKFTKENVDLYTIKGYSVIGKAFKFKCIKCMFREFWREKNQFLLPKFLENYFFHLHFLVKQIISFSMTRFKIGLRKFREKHYFKCP